MKGFKDLDFNEDGEYESSGSNIPLEFYLKTFPIAKKIDIFLGYYSSYVFKFLAPVMARFIYNGGEMRIITNEFLSVNDKNHLIENKSNLNNNFIKYLHESKRIDEVLYPESQHFYDCLKYLMNENRLKIKPVIFTKSGLEGLVHRKQMILFDGQDYISTNGSINFSVTAIIRNDESFSLSLPWESKKDSNRTRKRKDLFESVFLNKNPDYREVNSSEIITDIDKIANEKELYQLISDSKKLKISNFLPKKIQVLIEDSKNELEKILKEKQDPKFPHDEPYEYQTKAYENWKLNNYSGLFEMATGTGKTLTAILCMIEEYKLNNIQRNIIVVPGEELVRQWATELEECNFQNIFTWYSKNKKLNKEIDSIKAFKNVKNKHLNIVITYDSFKDTLKFNNIFKGNFEDFIVVFDEAHNMGSLGFMKSANNKKFNKRIGLSATPLRDWDEQGSNDFINNFFNSEKPVFKYTMKEAIGKYLCNYKYFPYFCFLEDNEWEEYKEFTRQIPKAPKDRTINQYAAMKRQAVIDKAFQKRSAVIKILKKLLEGKNISNTLVYCPKGKEDDDSDDEKVIRLIAESVASNFGDKIKAHFFLGGTKDRDLLLEDFENQEVDLLYAIKCLDEGVNVPSTQNAIFVASGKNKREFIQRRGRILRKFKGKEFANIYDIIVLPTNSQYYQEKNYSEKLLIGEFGRLIEFLQISVNKIDAEKIINEQLSQIELNYYKIKELIKQNEERRIDKKNS